MPQENPNVTVAKISAASELVVAVGPHELEGESRKAIDAAALYLIAMFAAEVTFPKPGQL